jgi:GT2 family glycosyltransferase
MVDPRTSVVVATRNRADRLKRLLAALDAQVAPPGGIETVVVDDGSTDSTLALLERSGVRYETGSQRGPGSARNAGWRVASGSIVLFTDDDCVPDASWAVEMVAAFDREPDVDGIGGAIQPLHHGLIEDFAHIERLADHGRSSDDAVRYVVTANAGYRRRALERVGGFDESFAKPAGEDVDLSERVRATGGRLGLAPAALVSHEYRPGFGPLLRTYYRHGEARFQLRTRHASMGIGTSTQSALRPAAWTERYHRYEQVGGRARAASYTALRVAASGAFVAGIASARLRGASS